MFTKTLSVRINDLNLGAHLGHVEFVHLLHEVRVCYLQHKGLSEVDMLGHGVVMRHMDVTYLNPAYLYDELQFELTIKADKLRFYFDYQVRNLTRDNAMGRASLQMVLVHAQSGRPLRIDATLREAMDLGV